MNPDKPEPQKVVIDMSHAWTEEDKKKSPEKWAEAKQDPVEQKEHPKRFASAREYIKNKIDQFKGNKDNVEIGQDWESVEGDLECGNERAVMQRLEYCAGAEHGSKSKKDIDLWRKSIFEISKDVNGTTRLMDSDNVGKSFYNEFEELQAEMNNELAKNPTNYNEQDIKNWDKEVVRWQDAANEILTNGNSENALVLLEQEIEDKASKDDLWRGELEEAAKGKNPNMKYITKMREDINANSKKLATYRRMRDSLYAIELNK